MCVKKLLSILVIGAVALALPISASALTISGKCEKEETCGTTCTSVCTVTVSNNTYELGAFSGTWSFSPAENASIVEVRAGDGWTLVSDPTSTAVSLEATGSVPVTASSFILFTVELEVEAGIEGCEFSLTGASFDRATPDNTDITVTVETVTSVSTGDTLPIVILACGIGAGVVIYVVTKKGKKIYKI